MKKIRKGRREEEKQEERKTISFSTTDVSNRKEEETHAEGRQKKREKLNTGREVSE